MPLIEVQVLEDVFSIEEKQALIKELAMAFGKVAGTTM
jgi:phenylpyruvate tautomerase PptA (4-oxalocrotonate tautomerase family)